MATNLVTITNISAQVVPIIIDSVLASLASASSDIAASRTEPVALAPGAGMTIEQSRVDAGQLEQLAKKRLITYSGI